MTQEELKGIPRFAPDFVIELVSDWKTLDRWRRKMPLWFANGVQLAQLVDPVVRAATIYRPREEPVTVSQDWLEGDGPVSALALAKNDPFVLVKSDHTKSTLGSGFGSRQTRMKIY
jgi:Uma2 family endonuclease